jgi:hypothetical protein
MILQITLEKALELVTFAKKLDGSWCVSRVKGSVYGDVDGSVHGSVGGSIRGSVHGHVLGTIDGKQWEFTETPKERLKRLIEEDANKDQLMEAFNQLEES